MDHFCDIQKGFMPLMHLADTMSTAAWGLSAHPWPSPVVCTEDAMVSPKSWNASGLGLEIFGRLGLWIGKFIDTLGLPWSIIPPQILCPGFVHPCFTLLIILNANTCSESHTSPLQMCLPSLPIWPFYHLLPRSITSLAPQRTNMVGDSEMS